MAALTTTGLVIDSAETIRASVNAALIAAFGPQVDTTDGSIIGQITAILVSLAAEEQELIQAVYGSLDPDQATGTSLDEVCALTGTVRQPAKAATSILTLTGTNSTVVPAGSQASVTGATSTFATNASATLVTLTSWAGSTVYAIGDRRTNAARCYVCTTNGTSASSGGPTTTASAITDGSVVWQYIGDGAAAVDAPSTALLTGVTVVIAGSITTIVTPVAGWTSVRNLLDDTAHASPGNAMETDQDLRIRRLEELAASGSAPIDALRADLLEVDGVTAVTVFANNGDTTDSNGTPPHAVQCLIQGGAPQDIGDQLLASVAAGIATYGTAAPVTSVDSVGTSHTMLYSIPAGVRIYVSITLTYDASLYPLGGDAAVQAALVALIAAQKSGKDVVASSVGAACFQVAGVLDTSVVHIGTAPSPSTGTTIPISLFQQATLSTGDITITSSPATP